MLTSSTRDGSAPPRDPFIARWWTFWLVWFVGPASYALCYVVCWLRPDLCTDPPNLAMACFLVATHLPAGFLTAALFIAGPRSRWRRPEYWMLLLYWLGILVWLAPGLVVFFWQEVLRSYPPSLLTLRSVGMCVSAIMVGLIPLVGALRLLTTPGALRRTS